MIYVFLFKGINLVNFDKMFLVFEEILGPLLLQEFIF